VNVNLRLQLLLQFPLNAFVYKLKEKRRAKRRERYLGRDSQRLQPLADGAAAAKADPCN